MSKNAMIRRTASHTAKRSVKRSVKCSVKCSVRHAASGFMLLSLLFPAVAHGLEADVDITNRLDTFRLDSSERRLANEPIPAPISPPSPEGVNIEEYIQFEGPPVDGGLTHEYTFTGREDDLIVVYVESSDGEKRGVYAELFDDDGEYIPVENNYEKGINLAEFRGRHRAFPLPATGAYRLVVFAHENGFPTAPESDGEAPPTEAREYLLRVRVASEYERLIVSASDMLEIDQFQDALDLFTLAIEQRPDQPLPYFGRMYAQSELALASAGLTDYDVEEPQEMYRLYQSVDGDVQQQVLADLQKVQEAFVAAMAQENLTEDELSIDLEYLSAIAQYFETGELPDYLKN